MNDLKKLQDTIERLKSVRSSIETRAITMLIQEVRKKVEHLEKVKLVMNDVEHLRKQQAQNREKKPEEEHAIAAVQRNAKVLAESVRQSKLELERLEKETTNLLSEIRRAFR